MPITDISRFLTLKQVAGRLHCNRRTLQRWAQEKNFGPPYIRIGRNYYYDPREFEAWIARQPSFTPPDAVA